MFKLINGKKGPYDVVVKVTAYDEILSFVEILFLLKHYFESEESYYSKPEYDGSCMLLKAIVDIYSGIPFEKVLKRYLLNGKKKFNLIDMRKTSTPKKPLEKLHEILKS